MSVVGAINTLVPVSCAKIKIGSSIHTGTAICGA